MNILGKALRTPPALSAARPWKQKKRGEKNCSIGPTPKHAQRYILSSVYKWASTTTPTPPPPSARPAVEFLRKGSTKSPNPGRHRARGQTEKTNTENALTPPFSPSFPRRPPGRTLATPCYIQYETRRRPRWRTSARRIRAASKQHMAAGGFWWGALGGAWPWAEGGADKECRPPHEAR